MSRARACNFDENGVASTFDPRSADNFRGSFFGEDGVGGRVDANVEDDTLDEVEEADIPELEFDELDRDEDVEYDLSGDVDGNE